MKIKVFCDKCGEALPIEKQTGTESGDIEVTVEPCRECTADAKKEAIAEYQFNE